MAPAPAPVRPAPAPPAAAPPPPVRPVPVAKPVRAYHPLPAKRKTGGMPLVVLMLTMTTPAVLAAAILRPRRGR
ncbi:hypothetical protein ACWF94_21480 [Streptomyces sp. NPDC055078]